VKTTDIGYRSRLGRRSEALLGVLLASTHPLTRADLADCLYGDDGPGGRDRVASVVFYVRHLVGRTAIVWRGGGYVAGPLLRKMPDATSSEPLLTPSDSQNRWSCRCQSCIRRRVKRGASGPAGGRVNGWSRVEDDIVRLFAGRGIDVVRAELERRCRSDRTRDAVRKRAGKLGVSLYLDSLSLTEAARMLGVTDESMRRLVGVGLLPARTEGDARRNGRYGIERADLERLVRSKPWLYDRTRIRDRRLRELADAAHRSDPYLTIPDIRRLLGVTRDTARSLCASGALPGAVRQWTGRLDWRVPAASVQDLARQRSATPEVAA
jgi:hypothetical protein